MRGQVLRAVAEQQLVAVHQRLHAADRGERRQHHHLDRLQLRLGQAEGDLLHQRDRLEVGEVHLPVARHQRAAGALGGRHRQSSSTAVSRATMPGRVRPSRYSSDAPPPVEMWSKATSATPSCRIAAAESPPPTTVKARLAAIASATPWVPAANGATSKTPIGPFQNTVPAPDTAPPKTLTVVGPTSSPLLPAGIASASTTCVLASSATSVATTMSTGRPIRSWSASSSESPTSKPRAARKVKHIPPPTSSRSTFGSSAEITPSLSETLLPPSTTTYGLGRSPARPVSRDSTASSSSSRSPA